MSSEGTNCSLTSRRTIGTGAGHLQLTVDLAGNEWMKAFLVLNFFFSFLAPTLNLLEHLCTLPKFLRSKLGVTVVLLKPHRDSPFGEKH